MPKYKPEQSEDPNAKEPYYIRIEDGAFKDICFNFEKIEFLGEDTEGNGRLAFEFDLISVPEGVILNDANKDEFEKTLGEIMKHILEEYILNAELPLDETLDEDRDADTK
jgi:hypothetical protein